MNQETLRKVFTLTGRLNPSPDLAIAKDKPFETSSVVEARAEPQTRPCEAVQHSSSLKNQLRPSPVELALMMLP